MSSLLFTLLLSLESLAALQCRDIFAMPFSLVTDFRPGPRADLYLTFRANAGHFWTWVKSINHPIFKLRGVVSGDPHILNYDDVLLRNGRRDLILTDLDDGAVNAPLLADFLRLAISNRVSPYKVRFRDMIEAYQKGISGDKIEIPEILIENRETSFAKSMRSVEQYVERSVKSGQLRLKKGMFRPSEADPVIDKIYSHSAKTFENYLNERSFEIVDIAFRVKDEGGSQNLPRFIYLLKKDGLYSIVEFKFAVPPAAGIFGPAVDAKTRFHEVMKRYGRLDTAPIFDMISVGPYDFHVREKQPPILEFDPTKVNAVEVRKHAEQIYIYLAYTLGRTHREEPGASALQIWLNEPTSATQSRIWVDEYINILTRLNEQHHSR